MAAPKLTAFQTDDVDATQPVKRPEKATVYLDLVLGEEVVRHLEQITVCMVGATEVGMLSAVSMLPFQDSFEHFLDSHKYVIRLWAFAEVFCAILLRVLAGYQTASLLARSGVTNIVLCDNREVAVTDVGRSEWLTENHVGLTRSVRVSSRSCPLMRSRGNLLTHARRSQAVAAHLSTHTGVFATVHTGSIEDVDADVCVTAPRPLDLTLSAHPRLYLSLEHLL